MSKYQKPHWTNYLSEGETIAKQGKKIEALQKENSRLLATIQRNNLLIRANERAVLVAAKKEWSSEQIQKAKTIAAGHSKK